MLNKIEKEILDLQKKLKFKFKEFFEEFSKNYNFKKEYEEDEINWDNILLNANEECIKLLSDNDLLYFHKILHDKYEEYENEEFDDLETILTSHFLVFQELAKRGLEHVYQGKLDFLSVPMTSYAVVERHEKVHKDHVKEEGKTPIKKFINEHRALVWQMKKLNLTHYKRNDDILDRKLEKKENNR